jgi:hypothetical protein
MTLKLLSASSLEIADRRYSSIARAHVLNIHAANVQTESGRWIRCSKSVVVLRSETLKLDTNGSIPRRCNCLRNIVESKIFRTGQSRGQVC